MKSVAAIAGLFAVILVPLLVASVAQARDADEPPVIYGEYLEARTCDVWTGPCFSNSELNTRGEFAVLGWAVERGTYAGQDLSGLKIAAALRAQGTLMSRGEGEVKTIVYVDKKADEAQAKALLAMARQLACKYFTNVLDIRKSEIRYKRDGEMATLEIKKVLKIRTQALHVHGDSVCGNEEVAYPSLAKTDKSRCAKTVEHFFGGHGLRAVWSDPFKRSAMIGSFSL